MVFCWVFHSWNRCRYVATQNSFSTPTTCCRRLHSLREIKEVKGGGGGGLLPGPPPPPRLPSSPKSVLALIVNTDCMFFKVVLCVASYPGYLCCIYGECVKLCVWLLWLLVLGTCFYEHHYCTDSAKNTSALLPPLHRPSVYIIYFYFYTCCCAVLFCMCS